MNEPRRHPVTLRFEDAALEERFLAQYVDKSKKTVRFGILLGVLVYGLLFGVMDWVQQTNALEAIWTIRAVACLLGVAVYFLIDTRLFDRYMQPILSGLIVVAGVGLVAMLLADYSTRAYLDGPVLVVLPAFVLFRLRFVYASAAGLFIFVLYCIAIYFVEGMRASELWSSAVFLFAANLIGMAAGYELENYARKEFWQTLQIDRERSANAELLTVKNRFFANISHEIRTPLTLIMGPLEDVISRSQGETRSMRRATLEAMRRSGYRLLKFLDQLLELSRLDAERTPVEWRKGDAVDFVRRLIASFLPYAETRSVALEFGSPEPAIPFVCDYEKLEVVLSNLVSNAIKYSHSGGNVRVTLSRAVGSSRVVIEVRDNGPGIAPDALEHLFERFYRAPETQRGNEGMGLGLSLTHSLVSLLGGAISVESEVGFGSTFRVELPVRESAEAPPYEASADNEPAGYFEEAIAPVESSSALPGDDKTVVLVIDDHADVRGYVKSCLEDDYEVVEAANGREGMEQAIQVVPDLIVTDLMMPAPGGIELAAEIRRHPVLNHIPIIMLTASVEPADRLRGLEAGVDDYMTKPFNREELLLRIRNLIAIRHRLRETYSHALLAPSELSEIESADHVFLSRVREQIEEHLPDEHFSADALADGIGMSVRQLQRKLRALTGETPTSQIRSMRLHRARQLIEGDFGSISEIAYAVGFNNPTYFTKCFRELFGQAPKGWKENLESRAGDHTPDERRQMGEDVEQE